MSANDERTPLYDLSAVAYAAERSILATYTHQIPMHLKATQVGLTGIQISH